MFQQLLYHAFHQVFLLRHTAAGHHLAEVRHSSSDAVVANCSTSSRGKKRIGGARPCLLELGRPSALIPVPCMCRQSCPCGSSQRIILSSRGERWCVGDDRTPNTQCFSYFMERHTAHIHPMSRRTSITGSTSARTNSATMIPATVAIRLLVMGGQPRIQLSA